MPLLSSHRKTSLFEFFIWRFEPRTSDILGRALPLSYTSANLTPSFPFWQHGGQGWGLNLAWCVPGKPSPTLSPILQL